MQHSFSLPHGVLVPFLMKQLEKRRAKKEEEVSSLELPNNMSQKPEEQQERTNMIVETVHCFSVEANMNMSRERGHDLFFV